MKFGESLSEGLVPEWKQQYLNYKEGKKLIKKVDELKAIVNQIPVVNNPPTSSDAMPSSLVRRKYNSPSKPHDRTPLLGPIEESVNPIGSHQIDELDSVDPTDVAPARKGTSLSFQKYVEESDQACGNLHENSNADSKSLPKRRGSFFNYSIKTSTKDKYTQQRSQFDSGKLDFVQWVNRELLKVDKFYLEKELEVYERFLILQDQLYQLREHKSEIISGRLKLVSEGKTVIDTTLHAPTFGGNTFINRASKGVLDAWNRYETPSLPSTKFLKEWKKKAKRSDDIALGTTKGEVDYDFEYDINYEQNRIRNGLANQNDRLDEDQNSITGGLLSVDSQITSAALEVEADNEAESIRSVAAVVSSAPSTISSGASGDNSTHRQQPMDTPIFRGASYDSNSAAPRSSTDIMVKKQARRDYVKKNTPHFRVPYIYAKRQLKTALLEHYRALTLLKSFRILNRTALRKITKKFDKSSGSSVSEDFMKKVDHSYFQTSDLIDKLIRQVEELYIAFFDPESSDRKHSLEKLKSIAYTMNSLDGAKPTSFYLPTFSDGLWIGFGIPLLVLGLYIALSKTILGELPEGKFLLQIWGGFFMIILMMVLFGVNLMVFDHFKINYKFIFEFDLATALDYKQFLVLPTFSFGFFAILFWFSFNNYWPLEFPGRDWPWIFFGTTLILFLWPGGIFYGSSRSWLRNAIWRLILSGFYPVEFRDFFLGDIFCSLTYTMGNLSFYFCLYSHHWNGLFSGNDNDVVCGSAKSRLMGFFSALPSIWRLLQCIRRYTDSGDWFPHLANLVKYGILTIYYMLLSIYRIENTEEHRIIFIVFATINSLYSAAWDILMDWSLLQSGSKNFLLRDHLLFKRPYYYYVAMILDIILRFQWVFYACFSNQIQQLAVTGFCVALAEIIRRFIWIFFRMENEHCTNVTMFRASRDSPIPYKVKHKAETAIKKLVKLRYEANKERNEDELLNKPGAAIPPIFSPRYKFSVDQTKYYDEEADLGLSPPPTTSGGVGTNAGPSTGISPESIGRTTGSSGRRPGANLLQAPSSASTRSEDRNKLRRQSTFQTITSALNKAHVKDFQRRKTHLNIENDSDDDDDDLK